MELTEIRVLVDQAVEKAYGSQSEMPKYEVGYAEPERGDFYTNAPFLFARVLKQSPQALADKLAQALSHHDLEKVEAVGGYVNITLKAEAWGRQLSSVPSWLDPGKPTGQKVQVEFISANPTGPLTLANARGGYLGDVLANVLSKVGHDVEREYYINDGGGQVKKLEESIKVSAGIVPKTEETQYRGDYVEKLAHELVKSGSEAPSDLGKQAVAEIVTWIKAAVASMGIEFDTWFSEASLIDSGAVAQILQQLQDKTYEKDGALWLATTKIGDERDRVLRKSDGETTYLANDLAYHANIFFERQFDRSIKIWGADHAGQVPSLKYAVAELAPDKQLDFILIQLVRLIKDGQEFKSSKRAGTYVAMSELLDEVGSDVARFFFLMRSADSQMDFDLDLAKEQSQKNPLFYVMYSYARVNSILSQASEQKLQPGQGLSEPNDLERRLIIQMSRWPLLLRQIAADYGVHRLTFYGIELAKLLHDYYESAKIISLPAEQAASKLYLLKQYKVFLEGYFEVLGITPVAKMTTKD